MSYLIDDKESARLDDLTAYNSTLLNALSSGALDLAFDPSWGEPFPKRHGRSDADWRKALLDNVHPDDLFEHLCSRCRYSLGKLGISEIRRA